MKRSSPLLHIVAGGFAAVALSSCASLVSYNEQLVTVSTGSVEHANCILTTSKGEKIRVDKTPERIRIPRELSRATVRCRKEGYPDGLTEIRSTFSPITFGNSLLLLFGLIPGPGWWIGGSLTVASIGYDFLSNAVWTWPRRINVDLIHDPDAESQTTPTIRRTTPSQPTTTAPLRSGDTLIIDLSQPDTSP